MASTISLKAAVAVITGASSGIGRETARQLARRGSCLVLAARRGEALDELADECLELGAPRAIVVPTDVTDEGAVEELARRARDELGGFDVWINNAGVYLMGVFDDVPTEAHRRVIETNLLGVIHGAKAAIAQFRAQGHGVLVNVASAAGKVGYGYASSYCASKFGVRGLGEALRQELLGTDIQVATVFPASVDTPFFEHAANFTGRKLRPMGSVDRPERIARAIISAVRRPRREVVIGVAPRGMRLMKSWFPRRAERMLARKVQRSHFEDTAVPRTVGNLFSATGPAQVHGGWRRIAPKIAVGAIAVAALGALAWRAAPRLRELAAR